MAGSETPYERLKAIIAAKEIRPTIVNPASKFVVVTYWWGRGVLNKNTARPCMEYYEKLITKPFEYLKNIRDVKFLNKLVSVENIKEWIQSTPELYKFYETKYEQIAKQRAELRKEQIIDVVAQTFFEQKEIAQNIQSILIKVRRDRLYYETYRHKMNNDALEDLMAVVGNNVKEYNAIKLLLKQKIRPVIANLEKDLMYQVPITYDQMIHNWEQKCAESGCNYMAVEYPEFARPGGYQMAINAKPLFIQKALNACDGRAVVYIDGDMTINMYPHIFDMDDVDFMARGWHMDPRANDKYGESILVDPYVFETSGGIMYFSNSIESKNLLYRWIQESSKPSQQGRADDRIISLIFNVRRLLASMKIIQLPIEYLWLTMSYDDYLDRDQIYVEHPECLTSEDTATSSGAASNRSAKFSGGIAEPFPRSEMLYECVMFPSKEMADQFRPWLNYMSEAMYFEDVKDEELVDEQPFYIVPFEKGFGKLQPLYEENMEKARSMPFEGMRTNLVENTVRINRIDTIKILNCLVNDVNVLYTPIDNKADIDNILSIINSEPGKRMELVFSDKNLDLESHLMLNYIIDTSKPIFIRAGNPILTMMMALIKSDAAESNENIAYARMRELFAEEKPLPFEHVLTSNYQFLSRIRVHVMSPKSKAIVAAGMIGGGMDRGTNIALEYLYPVSQNGGRRRRATRRRGRRSIRRHRATRHRKN